MAGHENTRWRRAIKAAEALFLTNELGSARNIGELTKIVSAKTGKRITIDHVDGPDLAMTTALWVEFSDSSLIVLRAQDPAYYQARGLFHELGHILFQHPACEALGTAMRADRYRGGHVRGRVLIPDHRQPTIYGNEQHEGEAEAMAKILGRHLLRARFDADDKMFG
ncbi:hypothetical protein [Microbacterium enclense]|uniref:hypothetical protein n=1 Tax=Microbacterium enclense TaxID=993073 RepID=UPI003F7EF411